MNKTEEAVEKALAARINIYLFRFFRTTTTVCITATIAMTGFLYSFGNYLYKHSEATKAAIDTFIEVKNRDEDV